MQLRSDDGQKKAKEGFLFKVTSTEVSFPASIIQELFFPNFILLGAATEFVLCVLKKKYPTPVLPLKTLVSLYRFKSQHTSFYLQIFQI